MSVQVVVLNGPGSVGKSSVARAMQEIAAGAWLHVAMDDFLAMMPPDLWGHPDGIVFLPGPEGTEVRCGRDVARLLDGMRRSVAALAAAGNRVILDEVILGGEQAEYDRLLAGVTTRWVGLKAPLAVLEAREAVRGDREPGLARWQHRRAHAGVRYDMVLDTGGAAPEDVAARIVAAFGL